MVDDPSTIFGRRSLQIGVVGGCSNRFLHIFVSTGYPIEVLSRIFCWGGGGGGGSRSLKTFLEPGSGDKIFLGFLGGSGGMLLRKILRR